MSTLKLPATASDVGAEDVHDVIAGRLVEAVFQPIVDLTTSEVVGYEALARGPRGSTLESPLVLFGEAAAAGRTDELDWVCRAAACRAALGAGLPASMALFVNAEPRTIRTPCPDDLVAVIARAERRLRIVTELTERAVAADPPALLLAAQEARAAGQLVAMDDVGVDPGSLALLPFVAPDVVKLDMSLVQDGVTPVNVRVVTAVQAHAERTGARILAEGIETAEHLALARIYGATLGQGWFFGRPGPLPARSAASGPRRSAPLERARGVSWSGAADATPFEIVSQQRPVVRATKRQLLPMSRLLETQAESGPDLPVLLACFQHARHFTPATNVRYRRLAETTRLLVVIGQGLAAEPLPGVRGVSLEPADRLAPEWDVIVVGPHFAGALIARELGGPTENDRDREFEVVVTHDRDLVLAAARSLLSRVTPALVLDA